MTPGSPDLHVIFGTGPLGLALMRELRARGHRVRMINRSARVGFAKDPSTEVGGGDAADPKLTREVCEGASVVYHCVGLPYARWNEFPGIMRGIVEGAASAGARLVYGDNLYGYGHVDGPIRDGLPESATTVKGRLRIEAATLLLDAHRAGRVRAAIGRGSDFFGPGATDNAMLGARVFGRLLAGKPAQFVGDPDRLHSYTYLPDFARALARLGEDGAGAGQSWIVPNAPAVTTRSIVQSIARIAGTGAKIAVLAPWMVGLLGVFSPVMRELKEMLYEFTDDFVTDSTRFEDSFDLHATPLDTALADTVAWWKAPPTATETLESPSRRRILP